jgi:hypothetical protein
MGARTVGPMTPSLGTEAVEAWRTRQARVQLAILGVAVAAAAIVVAWLAVGGAKPASPAPTGAGPRIVSQAQLENFARTLGQPLYWAGPKKGFELELTGASSGRIFVRYLPPGVRAGDPRPDFLSVGTYTRKQAFTDLAQASKHPGMVSSGTHGDGIVVFDSAAPTSVYLAYPGRPYQVEVFAPSSRTARALVVGGHVTPLS